MEGSIRSVDDIIGLAKAKTLDLVMANPSYVKTDRTTRQETIQKPPPEGFTKLINTDGSISSNTGMVGVGGLLRNSAGTWINGFSCKIGKTTSLAAELWV